MRHMKISFLMVHRSIYYIFSRWTSDIRFIAFQIYYFSQKFRRCQLRSFILQKGSMEAVWFKSSRSLLHENKAEKWHSSFSTKSGVVFFKFFTSKIFMGAAMEGGIIENFFLQKKNGYSRVPNERGKGG